MNLNQFGMMGGFHKSNRKLGSHFGIPRVYKGIQFICLWYFIIFYHHIYLPHSRSPHHQVIEDRLVLWAPGFALGARTSLSPAGRPTDSDTDFVETDKESMNAY